MRAGWLIGSSVQAIIYLCLMDIASGMDYLHSLGVLHGMLPHSFVRSGLKCHQAIKDFGMKPPSGRCDDSVCAPDAGTTALLPRPDTSCVPCR